MKRASSLSLLIACLFVADGFLNKLRLRVAVLRDVLKRPLSYSDGSGDNDANKSGVEEETSDRNMGFPLGLLGFKSSPYLKGELAGDAGWDPLRIVRNRDQLFLYREAEIKHARIAMLGALGWPVSELYHGLIASKLGLDNLLLDGKVPSVLNGGIDNTYILASLGGFFTVGSVLELELIRRKKETPVALRSFFDMWREDDWETPGNYNFDPLKLGKFLCGSDPSRKLVLQSIELFNGRFSMLACTGFAAQEFFTGLPVVKETPQFFSFCSDLWNAYCAPVWD